MIVDSLYHTMSQIKDQHSKRKILSNGKKNLDQHKNDYQWEKYNIM